MTCVPSVAFELTDMEATATSAIAAPHRRLFLGVFGASIALNFMNAGLACGFAHPGRAHPLLAGMYVATLLLYTMVFIAQWRGPKPSRQHSLAVAFDDVGMHLAGDAVPPRAVPWRAIRSVNDTGTVIVLLYGRWRSVIIPRRAYADNGVALWLLFGQRLIGSRSLHRRADARIIVNTAAR